MPRRVTKQIIYGFLYFVILSSIAFGTYFVFLKPAPSCNDGKLNQGEIEVDCGGPYCADCALKRLKPLKISSPEFFDFGGGQITALVQIQNPNLNYGASKFVYDLNFYEASGNILKTITDESFVYAGEIKTIVLASLDLDFKLIARGDMIVRDFVWQKPEVFERPDLNAREVSTKTEVNGVAVQGVIQNKNSYFIDRAVISAVVVNNLGLPIGASKTFVADLKPFEDRFFRVFIPATKDDLKNIDFSRTRIYIEARR